MGRDVGRGEEKRLNALETNYLRDMDRVPLSIRINNDIVWIRTRMVKKLEDSRFHILR